MNVKFTRKDKKFLKLVEEARDLFAEGYLSESEYPDMAEVQDSVYEHVLTGLGIHKGGVFIGCQYDIEDLEELIKEVKERKKKSEA